MTQYLLTVPHDSDDEPTMETMDPAELEAAVAATGAIIEELTSTGAFVFAGGLMPPSSAITVDNTGDSLNTVNGPFVEAPEYVGGFWVIDVADEEAAVGWAARASKALSGRIEVRAFQVPPSESSLGGASSRGRRPAGHLVVPDLAVGGDRLRRIATCALDGRAVALGETGRAHPGLERLLVTPAGDHQPLLAIVRGPRAARSPRSRRRRRRHRPAPRTGAPARRRCRPGR